VLLLLLKDDCVGEGGLEVSIENIATIYWECVLFVCRRIGYFFNYCQLGIKRCAI
jgi:hypothetical protein